MAIDVRVTLPSLPLSILVWPSRFREAKHFEQTLPDPTLRSGRFFFAFSCRSSSTYACDPRSADFVGGRSVRLGLLNSNVIAHMLLRLQCVRGRY